MDVNLFLSYLLRSLPGLVVGSLFLVTLPKNRPESRIFAYIIMLILLRDTMTPLQLWSLGSEGWFWIRVRELPILLLMLGFASAGIALAINWYEPDLRRLIVWFKAQPLVCVFAGLVGAVVIATPVILLYQTVSIDQRGGTVSFGLIPILLVFCLLVNFYEELLFRGYFQGFIELHTSPLRAALLSGILFSFAHTFLATTVTNVGAPLVLFTLYEGVIAGLVRMRYGLIASIVTHGVGIFLLCSGIF